MLCLQFEGIWLAEPLFFFYIYKLSIFLILSFGFSSRHPYLHPFIYLLVYSAVHLSPLSVCLSHLRTRFVSTGFMWLARCSFWHLFWNFVLMVLSFSSPQSKQIYLPEYKTFHYCKQLPLILHLVHPNITSPTWRS